MTLNELLTQLQNKNYKVVSTKPIPGVKEPGTIQDIHFYSTKNSADVEVLFPGNKWNITFHANEKDNQLHYIKDLKTFGAE